MMTHALSEMTSSFIFVVQSMSAFLSPQGISLHTTFQVTITQFYQPLLSLTSIYLQFIVPDEFQPHGAILSGSMFGSTLHVIVYHPKNYKMSQLSPVIH
jgi:hypothetical protein